jgi:membrane-associated protease RseP (regulator of RpoE activity)
MPPRPRERVLKYIVLFLLTLVTTTLAGVGHYAGFILAFSGDRLALSTTQLLANGLWYSLPILLILGCHEFGHYFACRYYRVDASLPYFLPIYIPLPGAGPLLTGTLGAIIRIRQPIPGKRALFDIGIAGPIAGFVIAVPTLLIGMYLSTVVALPPAEYQGDLIELGEPLLFKAAAWLTFGAIQDGFTVNLHPIGFAAWFGMFATALNLFPLGQLDGGHIAYAVFGRRSTMITWATVLALVGLSFVSQSWWIWTALTLVMLFFLGPHHPRVFDEEVRLNPGRLWLALFALLMFIACFTPAPLEFKNLVGR